MRVGQIDTIFYFSLCHRAEVCLCIHAQLFLHLVVLMYATMYLIYARKCVGQIDLLIIFNHNFIKKN